MSWFWIFVLVFFAAFLAIIAMALAAACKAETPDTDPFSGRKF